MSAPPETVDAAPSPPPPGPGVGEPAPWFVARSTSNPRFSFHTIAGRYVALCFAGSAGHPLVAAALAEAAPDQVWECSHLGGDRFAGNVLVLPDGLGFGRVDPDRAAGLLDDLARGLLDLDLMRGRATLSMPAQYAEIHLRRELGERRDDAVRHLGSRRDQDEVVSTFDVAGATYDVRVVSTFGDPAALTCRAKRDNPVLRHEVTSTTRR